MKPRVPFVLALRHSHIATGIAVVVAGATGPALAQETDTTRVTITGTVVDFGSWDPIEGVEVRLTDLGISVKSDSLGEFVLASIALGVTPMEMEREGYIRAVGSFTIVQAGSFVLHLRPLGAPEPGSLLGRVVDPSTGNPVETAEVTLQGTDLHRLTDAEGRFAFEEVPPGPHDLEVERLGYSPRSDRIHLFSGRNTEVEIPLAFQPIEMDPITVTAQSRWMERNGFYRRMGGDYAGRQWTAEEIQESGVRFLGDLLSEVEGIRVVWEGTRGLSILSSKENPGRMGGSRSRTGRGAGSHGPGWCEMPLFVDDIRIHEFDLDMVVPSSVEGLEVYHGIKTPARYRLGNPCGVILVWTR